MRLLPESHEFRLHSIANPLSAINGFDSRLTPLVRGCHPRSVLDSETTVLNGPVGERREKSILTTSGGRRSLMVQMMRGHRVNTPGNAFVMQIADADLPVGEMG